MNNDFRCELVSWSRFYSLSRQLVANIRKAGYHPDLIVAIARGGYMPARVISDFLGLMDLTSLKIEHYAGPQKHALAKVRYPLTTAVSGRRILLVDDVSDTGDTFRLAVSHIKEHGQPAALRSAVLHHKLVSDYVPDFFARKVIKWRWIIYPWAVIEDLTTLILKLEPRPTQPDAIASELERRHRLRVPRQLLLDALGILDDLPPI